MYRSLGGIFLFCCLFSINIGAQEISPNDEWRIKVEIKQLSDNYGYYRDHFMVDEYLSIWAEDAIAIDGDRMWEGHEELRTRVPAPTSTRLSMHVMSTSHIDIIDESHATGVHYATIYGARLDGPREQNEIIETGGVYLIAKYTDEYVLTDEGWKISRREIDRVFSN